MIATVSGVLVAREADAVMIQTDGGVGYEVSVPLGVFERLPAQGSRCTLHTELIVREDAWTLYGFDSVVERSIFQRLLSATGLGPRLALAILSTLGPDRAVRSIQGKDIAALSTVSGIGKKRAEKLVVELSDRFKEFQSMASVRPSRPADEAARALGALGYPPAAADEAVRSVLAVEKTDDVAALIKLALRHLTTPKGGRA